VSAEDAAAQGLITRVVDEADLLAAGREAAQTLATSATTALGAARNLLLASFESSLESHLENEARGIATCSKSADAREGVAAFSEKRAANFRGA